MNWTQQQFCALPVSQAMDIAFAAHFANHFDQAEQMYRWILAMQPEHAEATHLLGVLLHQRDRSDAGLSLVSQSLALEPRRADWHNDLGNMLSERGESQRAAEAFMAALDLTPTDAQVWNNLGAVLQRMQQPADAEYAYRQAILCDADCVSALNNLGNLLSLHGRTSEAAIYLSMALLANPDDCLSRKALGIAYYTLGRIPEAAANYRAWLTSEPDDPTAQHMYAACSGENIPPRASDAYIATTFDEFAERFEQNLLEQLAYAAPRLIAASLARLTLPATVLRVLDAGCGTGLCGAVLKLYATELFGVDLSPKMLARARAKALYDELWCEELTTYMASRPDAFELIVIADTLIYFGELDPPLAAANAALTHQGILLFTVEDASADEGFCLKPNGRYGHGKRYLMASLERHRFVLQEMKRVVLRMELGAPVWGYVVSARRGG